MSKEQADKRITSFRLMEAAHELLAALARKLGVPRSGILELLIREKAKAEQIVLKQEKRDG
jgi:hypothetical protein